jgi:hypothetical protein
VCRFYRCGVETMSALGAGYQIFALWSGAARASFPGGHWGRGDACPHGARSGARLRANALRVAGNSPRPRRCGCSMS